MGERERVTRNAGISLFSETLNLLLTMVGGIIMARYLGKERFGTYSFAMSWAALAMVLTDLGMSTLITREVSRDRSLAAKYLPASMALRVTMGIVLMCAFAAAAGAIAPTAESASALRWLAPTLALAPLAAYYVLFRATERLDLAAVVQVLSKITLVAAIVIASVFNLGIRGVVLANCVGYIATAALTFALARRAGHAVSVSFDMKTWRVLLVRGTPFIAMGILSEIYNRIDHVLIPYLDSMGNNGLYGVATRVAFMFTVVPNAAAAAVFPYFSRRSTESSEPLRTGVLALYRHLGMLGLGAAVFVGIPATFWIKLLFGGQFTAAAPSLSVHMAAIPLMFFVAVHVSALYALEKQNKVLLFMAAGIVADVILDVVLIKTIGFIGAAFATLATNLLFFILSFYALRKAVGPLPFFANIIRPAICAAAAGLCLFFLPAWPEPIRIAAAAAVFLALLPAVKAVTADDIRLYASIAKGRGKQPPAA